MKKSIFFLRSGILACAMLFLFGCGSEGSKQSDSSTSELVLNTTISSNDAQQFLLSYLQIKDDLVQTNSEATAESARKLASLFEDNSDPLAQSMFADAQQISNTNYVSIQRDHFNSLSQKMYGLVKQLGVSETAVYKQFCPMAFDNEGAYWLSIEKQVNNPYFGDQMLHCGSVKETILPAK